MAQAPQQLVQPCLLLAKEPQWFLPGGWWWKLASDERSRGKGDLGKNLKGLDLRLIPEVVGLLLRLTRCQNISKQQQTERKITSVSVIEHTVMG